MKFNTRSVTANWNYPTSIIFGIGRISSLAESCKNLKIKKPLLITDRKLAKLPMITDAITTNEEAGLSTGLYSEIQPNPIGQNVIDGKAIYQNGHFDGIIAWGGGSSIDVAKAIALMVGQNRPLWDFEDTGDNWLRANVKGIAPVIAVPTTSGTGSEVGRASVIINEATRTKKVIFHPEMLPRIVICDPNLVSQLPASLTAFTGMDALAHCFEAYCAPAYHPMAEGVALEGMRLVAEWLPRAFQDGQDLEARSHMMSAAAMGATAFQKGLGAVHSLSHPVGSVYDTHHGLTNAVFMPYVMSFNRPAIEEKMELLARYLNLAPFSYTGVLDWILELREKFSIPSNAKNLGAEIDCIDLLAEMAANDPTASGNPIPVGVPEMRKMYETAFEGRI